MSIPLEFFLSGLLLGVGPCSAFCLPILIPYIASTREGLVEGIKTTLAFSVSRLSAYTLLGLAAGLFGEALIAFLLGTGFSFYVVAGGGAFLTLLGLLILVGGEPKVASYRILFRHAIQDGLKSMALMGFMVGVKPCAPLLGILIYISLSVKDPLLGAFYGACFGLGASIFTPIIAVGVVAGLAPRMIFRTPQIYKVFKKGCGLLLILFGVRLMASQMLGMALYW